MTEHCPSVSKETDKQQMDPFLGNYSVFKIAYVSLQRACPINFIRNALVG